MGWTGSAVAAGSCCEGPCLKRAERSLTKDELEEQDSQRKGEGGSAQQGRHDESQHSSLQSLSPVRQRLSSI